MVSLSSVTSDRLLHVVHLTPLLYATRRNNNLCERIVHFERFSLPEAAFELVKQTSIKEKKRKKKNKEPSLSSPMTG